MNNYTINTISSANFAVRIPKTCKKYSRCNKFKICPTCNLIREKKLKKSLKFIQEKDILKYEHKKYLVITSNDLSHNFYKKNKKIDSFRKAFLDKKINKNFCINRDTQYFITKEISYNKKLGYNPHLNIILLSDLDFDINNKQLQKLLKQFDIDIHVEDIYTTNNNYKDSIDNIISYSIKFNEDRAYIENTNNITHNKRDIFKSNFFKQKKSLSYLHNLIFNKNIFKSKSIKKSRSYLYIYIRALKVQTSKDLKQSKQLFKRNANKSHPKNYIRLLKSLQKKKIIIFAREARKIKRARASFRAIFPLSVRTPKQGLIK